MLNSYEETKSTELAQHLFVSTQAITWIYDKHRSVYFDMLEGWS